MISFTGSDSVGGGGGGSSRNFSRCKSIAFPQFRHILGTFSGHRRVTRRLRTLTQIQAHFPGLLTHSNHVTTSIHSRKINLTKVWGGAWPPWPPPWLRHWSQRMALSRFLTGPLTCPSYGCEEKYDDRKLRDLPKNVWPVGA